MNRKIISTMKRNGRWKEIPSPVWQIRRLSVEGGRTPAHRERPPKNSSGVPR